jgi:ABC-type nitrate/sulfonate/bicarbonate transport system substrate-binding protein
MGRFLAIIATAAALAAPDARAEPVKLSIPNVHAGFSHVFIAEDKGYFKEEGLDVQVSVVPGGTATPALIGGSLDYSSSPSASLSAILRGAPLRVVLATGTRPIFEMWSFDPAIRTIEDLKGQQIAIMTRGGTDEIGMRMLLKQRNLPQDYVSFSALGREGRMAALIAGAQKLSLVGRIERDELDKAGLIARGHMVFDLAKHVELASGGLVTTEREITVNRERARKVVRAFWKGRIYMKTIDDDTLDIIQKRLPKTPREILMRDLSAAREDASDAGMMETAATEKEIQVRGEINNIAADKLPPAEKVYDFSLIREILTELAAANWRPTP